MDPKAKLAQIQARQDRQEDRRRAAAERAAEAQRRAAQAQATLDSPALQRAFAELEALYTARWRDSKPGEETTREDAWHQLRALGMVKAHLQATIAGGKVAG